jgi:uncharacterized RDD family membrane protein YckC
MADALPPKPATARRRNGRGARGPARLPEAGAPRRRPVAPSARYTPPGTGDRAARTAGARRVPPRRVADAVPWASGPGPQATDRPARLGARLAATVTALTGRRPASRPSDPGPDTGDGAVVRVLTGRRPRRRPVDPGRAPIGRRVVAALVDLALVPVVVLGVAELAWRSGLLGLLGVGPQAWAAWSWSFGPVAWTVAAAALAYHFACTARWGRTAGKRLVGLRVEAPGGGPVGPWRALWRGVWGAALFLPSVFAPVLAVAAGVAVAAGSRRSPADRAAGTRVVLAAR